MRGFRRIARSRRPFEFAIAALVVGFLTAAPSRAATLTWGTSGTGGDGTWTDGAGGWWNGSAANWTNGDSAIFPGTPGTVTLGGNVTSGSVLFAVDGYTIAAGNTLTLTTGFTADGSATVNSAVALGANQSWSVAAGETLTLGGVVSGGSTLTYGGSGTYAVNANNTATGNVTISGATVTVAPSGATLLAFGAGYPGFRSVTIQNGGTLSAPDWAATAGEVSDAAGNMVFGTGGGTFIMNKSGDMGSTVNKGITVGSGVTGRFEVAAGISGTWSGSYGGRDFIVNSGGTLEFGGAGTFTTARIISGAGGVTKTGVGRLTLQQGGNSFSGPLVIAGGTLDAAAATGGGTGSSIGNGSNAITIGGGGTLLFSGARGAGYHTGPVTINGGTLTFDSPDNSLAVGNTVTLGSSAATINGSGQWRFRGGATMRVLPAADGSTIGVATLDLYDGTETFSIDPGATLTISSLITNDGGGNLLKTGSGTMVLSSANSTFSGAVTVRAGTLVAGANAPSGSVGAFGNATSAIVVGDGSTGATDAPGVLIGGGFTVGRPISVGSAAASAYTPVLGGTNTAGTATFAGNVTLAATGYAGLLLRAAPDGTVDFTGTWTTNGKPVTVGSAGNTGTVKLSSAMATTGGVSVNAGRLLLGTASALGGTTPVTMGGGTLDIAALAATIGTLSGSGTITGTAGGVLTVTQAATGTFSGAIAGGAGLTKSGASTLTLTGSSATTGAVTVNVGSLVVGAGGSVAAATVTVAGGGSLGGAGTAGSTTVLDGGILAPGTSGVGTLSLSTLTFGTTAGDTATVSIPTTGLASIPATLQVAGDVVANGGEGNVTFAFGSLTNVLTGTYPLITYAGSFLSGTSPFTYSGSLGGRQAVNFEDAAGALNLVISNAFPIWSGSNGTGWTATDNWKLNSTGAPTSFQANDSVVFDDAAVTGTVTISGSSVNPVTTTFSGTTLAYTLESTGGFGISTGALIKSGPASLTIANSNSFAGGTTLSAGILRIGNDAALGTGTVALNGGTLSSDSGSARTLANAIVIGDGVTLGDAANDGALELSGPIDLGGATRSLATPSNVTLSGGVSNGSLVKAGAGRLSLTGAASLSGATTIAGGTLQIGGGGVINAGSYASGIAIASGAALSIATSANQTLAGVISGAGSLAKSGAGLLTLSGGNTYAGRTTITGGTVSIAADGGLGAAPGSPVADQLSLDGGALRITAGSQTLAANRGITLGTGGGTIDTSSIAGIQTTTIAGVIAGTGPLTLRSTGDQSANGGGDGGRGILLNATNTFSGTITVTTGFLSYASDAALGDAANRIVLAGGGLLDNGSNIAMTHPIVISAGTSTFRTYGGASPTWSGALSGAATVNRTDGGTLTLTGDLSGFTGTYDNLAGATVLSGGAAGLGAGARLRVSGSTVTFASGRLGSGTAVMNGGTLRWAGGNTDGSVNIALVNGVTATFDTNGNDVSLANGFGAGTSGNVTKIGAGTLTLTGSNTFTGQTRVRSGTLALAAGRFGDGSANGTSRAITVGPSAGDNGTFVVSSGTVAQSGAAGLMIGDAGTGTFVQSGGSVTLGSGGLWIADDTTGVGTATFGGGTFTNTGGPTVLATRNQGTITVTGTATVTLGTLQMGYAGIGVSTQSATLNLDGGRLAVTDVTNPSGTGVFSFNSGTLAARANNASFIAGLDVVDIKAGGAIIDTAGFAVTIGQALNQNAGSTGGGLTKLGSGTLTLASANGYTGPTTVSAGVLALSGAGDVASSSGMNLAAPGATLDISAASGSRTIGSLVGAAGSAVVLGGNGLTAGGGSNTTFAGSISGAGGFTKAGAGTLTLVASTGYSGLTTISAGTLALSGAADIASSSGVDLSASGATLDISAASGGRTIGSLAGAAGSAIVLGTNGLTAGDGSNTTFAGTIDGAGGLTKAGAGLLSLAGASTFGGDTTIASGTLQIGGSGQLGSGSYAGAISNAGVLDHASSANQTLSGTLAGTGSLVKSGASTLTLSASNAFSGGSTVSAGVLAFAAGALGTGTTTLNGGTLRWATGNAEDVSSQLALVNGVTATLDTNGNTVTLAGGLGAGTSAGLTKAGAGTLTLSGSSGYTGNTAVNEGTLAIAGAGDIASSPGVSIASGATLDIAGASGLVNVGTLSGAGDVTLGGNTLRTTVLGESIQFDGVISGSGGFTKAGSDTLILTGAQAFTGPATVEAGTLVLPNGTELEQASVIAVLASGILDTPGLTIVLDQTLAGHGTVSGPVTFASGGILSPGGSVGTLTNDGSTTWNAAMRYVFEVNDATGTPGGDPGWDLFSVTGDLTLAASAGSPIIIDLTSLAGTSPGLAANFDPGSSYQWLIADAGFEITTFDQTWFQVLTANFDNLPGDASLFSVVRGDALGLGNDQLYLTYAAIPEPSTLALAGVGLAAAGWACTRRRRKIPGTQVVSM